MFYKQIKDLRIEANMTQREVATKLNISRARYSQYELGKRTPDYDMLAQIADLYDVSIDSLIRGTEVAVDYILERTDQHQNKAKEDTIELNDLAYDVDNLINKIEREKCLMYKGVPLNKEDRQVFKRAALLMEEMIKLNYEIKSDYKEKC